MKEENVVKELIGRLNDSRNEIRALFSSTDQFPSEVALGLLEIYSFFIEEIEKKLLSTKQGQKALKRFYKVQREKVKTTYNNRKVSKTTKNGVKRL